MKPDPGDSQFIWLQAAMLRLYDQVEPGAHVTGIAISVSTAENENLLYNIERSAREIRRMMLTPEAFSISRDFTKATIDLTPEAAP
jgi:hypothetical protein